MVERSASPPRAHDRAWAILGGIALLAIAAVVGAVLILVTVGRGWLPSGGDAGRHPLPRRCARPRRSS